MRSCLIQRKQSGLREPSFSGPRTIQASRPSRSIYETQNPPHLAGVIDRFFERTGCAGPQRRRFARIARDTFLMPNSEWAEMVGGDLLAEHAGLPITESGEKRIRICIRSGTR